MSAESLKLHTAESAAPIPAVAASPIDIAAGFTKRLIRMADLFRQLDVSKPTGYRLLAAGKIGPRPIRLTSACVRFDAHEVCAWLKTRAADGNLHDAASWPRVWEMIQRTRS